MTAFDDPDGLDLRAYVALRGATLDWRSDLAKLLRSDVPLSRLFRDALAAAVENEFGDGPSLDLRNIKPARDRFAKAASRYEWMQIGRWIEAKLAGGDRLNIVLVAAADRFGASEKKCEGALTYYRRAKPWIERALSTSAGDAMGKDILETLLHQIEADPLVKRLNANLLRELGLSQ